MTDIIELSGVGPALAKTLKEHRLHTVEAVAAASLEDLKAIPGIGAARAMRLKRAAEAEGSGEAKPAAAPAKPAAAGAVKSGGAGAAKTNLPAKAKAKPVEITQGSTAAGSDVVSVSEIEEALSIALAAAEAAREAAEQKAAKAKAKAKKSARKAEALMEEFGKAKEKARTKAKKMKAEAHWAIEDEKAKAKAILEGLAQKSKDMGKEKDKNKKLLILDPPRTGFSKESAAIIAKVQPEFILYVSCEPSTLARDLKGLNVGDKYELKNAAALDMFPQTSHFESMVLLELKK